MVLYCLDCEADFVFDGVGGAVRLRKSAATRLMLLAPMLRRIDAMLVVAVTKVRARALAPLFGALKRAAAVFLRVLLSRQRCSLRD